MIKLFIYNRESPESQMAYRALMQSGVDMKTIEVTGQNVARRLKTIGVTHVPTLYLRDDRNVKMLVGREILEFLQEDEESSSVSQEYLPPRHQRPTKAAKVAKKKLGKIVKSESSEIVSDDGLEPDSEINSEINSDDSVVEQIQLGEESAGDNDELENEKGKLNPKAVMRMMQAQNAQAQGLD